MLFAIDFVEATERRDIISGTAGYSGLQTGFFKTHKMLHRCPHSPTYLLPNKWSVGARLSLWRGGRSPLNTAPLRGELSQQNCLYLF
jgi:hypothetical protein